MEEILEYLEKLKSSEKNEVIKNLISERRKEIIGLISQNNINTKKNDIENIDLTRTKIKRLKEEILLLQNLKKEPTHSQEKNKNPKKNTTEKNLLNKKDLEYLSKYISGNHMKILTEFDDIEISLLEHLLQLKQNYMTNKKTINKKVKNIKKSIKILSDFSSEQNTKLNEMLDNNLYLRKILSKVIKYLDKLIRIEFKKKNSLTRKERRLIETLFADKLGEKEKIPLKDYTTEELYSTYYELIFKDRNLTEITDLLEKYPDLYLLKNKKKVFYELILDKYANVLLNKNYIENTEKCKKNKEELEYYKKLIVNYLAYSFENDKPIIRDLTIKKIERITTIFNNNDIYIEKSNEILNQIKYFQEIIHLGSIQSNDLVKEINNEYIFSIDSDGTQIIEDALSLRKDQNHYYVNFYIPDLISFIPENSILEKKALERYKSSKYAFPHDIIKFFKFNQGRKKRVIGYHFIFDKDGKILDMKIEKNLVKLYNSYTFEQFNKLFLSEEKIPNDMKEIYEKLSNKKLEDNNSGLILSFLIQYCGINLGKYLGSKNIMCIYKNISSGEVHSTWNENDYVEFTSPIRSYISFYNQRAMFSQNKELLNEQCEIVNQKIKKF